MMQRLSVRECSAGSSEGEVTGVREPAVIRGATLGEAPRLWRDIDYLAQKCSGREVRVHCSTTPHMDFITKNFSYMTLPFDELIKLASSSCGKPGVQPGPSKYYYLRSLGNNPRKDVADFHRDYPELCADLNLPCLFAPERKFSSVFRVSSANLCLWTHYDVMDNILVEVVGRKKVVLFPPTDAPYLYLVGDKSKVTNIEEPDLTRYPNFVHATRYECILEAGDILFIPALWFHHVTALDFAVAVNVFWRQLPKELYDSKDPYGNKDPLPAQKAMQMVERAVKQLDSLPDDHKDFYCLRLMSCIENKLSVKFNSK